MTDTPSAPGAQAPSIHRRRFNFEPRPIDPATRRRRIKIARAVCLVGRTKCTVSVALRATGLDHDHNAREEVCDLLDRKGISRIRKGVRRVRFKETPSQIFEAFIPPRQEETRVSRLPPSRRALAEMARELIEIADPLGDDGGETSQAGKFDYAPKPKPIATCTCGVTFEGRAKFCSVKYRVRDWRQAKRAAEDKLSALQAASAKLAAEHAAIEREIEAIVDKRCRSETVAALGAMTARLEKAQAAHQAAALELEMSCRECALVALEGHPISAFVLDKRQQLEPAIPALIEAVKHHARAVAAGTARASLPRPEPEPVRLALVPPPPMMTIFATKNLKFVDAAGGVTCIGANKMHSIPKALAELALAQHMALPLSEKQKIRDLEYGAVSYLPDPAACTWLGERGAEPPARSARPGRPITHSSLTTFEVMDRGPALHGVVPAQPIAVGARKMPDEE